jgi:hypothetical protein
MRSLKLAITVVVAAGVLGQSAAAQTPQPAAKPAPAKPAAAKPAAKGPAPNVHGAPMGNLAQVMRGILFPNSNILFDVQSTDPAAPKKEATGAGATATFANIYTGWQTVENAAISIGEAATLMMIPGRLCENGKPVPLTQADYIGWTADLRKVSQLMLKAAQTKNQEKASDATNEVAGACENCHTKYRDTANGPRCTP